MRWLLYVGVFILTLAALQAASRALRSTTFASSTHVTKHRTTLLHHASA